MKVEEKKHPIILQFLIRYGREGSTIFPLNLLMPDNPTDHVLLCAYQLPGWICAITIWRSTVL